MTVVLTTSPGFGRHGRVPARIEAEGWTFLRAADAAEMEAHLPEADYLVVGLVPVTAEVLAKGPRLKGVLKHGVGVDNIDIPACTAAGLPVTNTPAANADAVAELAMGLMFAMARFIPQGHASVTSGGWDRRIGTQLGGKVLGIVGLGNIGKRLARLARGLGMEVLATDRVEDPAFARDCGVTYLPLEELLARADYVSLHVFGGAGNAALIDDRALARRHPSILGRP